MMVYSIKQIQQNIVPQKKTPHTLCNNLINSKFFKMKK